MNPFDWPGPAFLLFYVVLCVVTIVVMKGARRRREEAMPPADPEAAKRETLREPYRVAFLRGGANEVIRVAIVALIDRGLLTTNGDRLQTTELGRETAAAKGIERELLRLCESQPAVQELFRSPTVLAACGEYEERLQQQRFLLDEELRAQVLMIFLTGAALLVTVALVKTYLALDRGHSNVEFLLGCCLMAVVLGGVMLLRKRTARGNAFLREVRHLFRELRARAPQVQPGSSGAEAVMLASVFGVGVLTGTAFAWKDKLFPHAANSFASGGGDSADASSASCGGSSGCGGGGCGGCGGS